MTSPGLSSELGDFQFSGSCFARVHWSLHRGGDVFRLITKAELYLVRANGNILYLIAVAFRTLDEHGKVNM